MERERDGMARAGCCVALAALAAVAGCSGLSDGDASAPRVVRVVAYGDPTGANAPIVVDAPGAAATLADVPTALGVIRIEFSKPLDGATIQANAGSGPCEAAANVRITRDGDDVTPTAEVCYDPGGMNPGLTAIPEASGALVPGATYVLRATDLADLERHKLSFTLTVTAAAAAASAAGDGF